MMRLPVPRTKIAVGDKLARLTVIAAAGRRLKVRCECGKIKIVLRHNVVAGRTQSCGCLQRERVPRTHGQSNSPEYISWKGMIQRCQNPRNPNFGKYGARGIRVCREWQTFEKFYADMGPRPTAAHTIERTDNSAGYSPSNCQWATMAEQNRNKRSNRFIIFDGRRLCLQEWATELGIGHETLRERLEKWPLERALTEPSRYAK